MPEKKYKAAKKLAAAIDDYFKSITRTRVVTEVFNTGAKDSWGHFVMDVREVVADTGAPMQQTEFVLPPSIAGLCQHIGIARSTWYAYCDAEQNPQFAGVTTAARERIEAWYVEQLLTRTKGTRGIEFVLQNGFGYRDRKEVEVGPEAKQAISSAQIPLSQRQQLLRQIAEEFAAPEETEEGGL